VNGWRDIKLKEVSEYVTVGFVGSMADQYVEAGVPFLRSLNIHPFRLNYNDLKYIPESFHDAIKKSKLRPGDVAIVRTGYPGTACVIPADLPDSNCSDLVILRPSPELNPHYIAAVFNSSFGQSLVGGNLVGAAQQHFNVTVAKELKLRLPPRAEQDKIAALLVGLNDLIANNQRRIALLESMAEEIYREWFVRMRFPQYATLKGDELVPPGWSRQPIGEPAVLIKRGISPDYADQSEHQVINQKCIRGGRLSLAEARPHATVVPEDKVLRYGDVLINSTGVGTLGRAAVFDIDADGVTCDSHVTILRPKDLAHSGEFLAYTIQLLQPHFESMAAGSTGQAELSRELISRTKVLVPTADLLTRFSNVAAPIRRQRRLLLDQNEKLSATRDHLLPRLIAGKLRVDHLDIQFPPSMKPPAEAAQAEAQA
jgi:type I restriction enzyme, S subunit